MTGQVPLLNANLMTLCLEGFLYGIFFTLAVLSIFLLVSHHAERRRRGDAGSRKVHQMSSWSLFKSPMFVTAIVLSITCTVHWVMTVIRAFDAFVYSKNGPSQTPLSFYANLGQVLAVAKTGIGLLSLCIGDAAIIYRLWVIYGRTIPIIIFPTCTLLALFICVIGSMYEMTHYTPGQDIFFSSAVALWTSNCVFTLCTNLYSTVAIAIRVWRNHHDLERYGGVDVLFVLSVLVESAAMYTAWTIFFFAAYESGSNIQFTALGCYPIVAGIAFMLINVRVGLGWESTGQAEASTRTQQSLSSTGTPDVFAGVGSAQPQWNDRRVPERRGQLPLGRNDSIESVSASAPSLARLTSRMGDCTASDDISLTALKESEPSSMREAA